MGARSKTWRDGGGGGRWTETAATARNSTFNVLLLIFLLLVCQSQRTQCAFFSRRPKLAHAEWILLDGPRLETGYCDSGCPNEKDNHDQNVLFPTQPPYLAVITEPDACDSNEAVERTVRAISRAVSTGFVSLVSLRVAVPPLSSAVAFQRRLRQLTRQVNQLSRSHAFLWVVNTQVEVALQGNAHGVHLKEAMAESIPQVRAQLASCRHRRRHANNNRHAASAPVVGTSVHTVESALQVCRGDYSPPDYLLVGTCFPTASHPTKTQLEGPALPGKVKQTLLETQQTLGQRQPVVFAIGGINETNCDIPILHGADGVAVIRAVLHAEDPAVAATNIYHTMKRSFSNGKR